MRNLLATAAAALALLGVLSGVSEGRASADPVERRLHADQVTASSFLWNDWNRFQENYHPLYVSDDDPKTAWTEGAPSSGAGEWLRLGVTKLDGATRLRLRVRAGYQKSTPLFKANARPKDVTIKLLPSGTAKQVTLADQEGWQEVTVDQPAGPLDVIELRFGAVYEGSKYTDLCISDLQVFVTAETRENPAYEKSKLDKVLAWKASRLEAARAFKQNAGKEFPLLPGYKFSRTDGPAEVGSLWERCGGDQLCWTRAALAQAKLDPLVGKHTAALALAEQALAGQTGFTVGQVAPIDKRPIPAVDGLIVPGLHQALEMGYGNDAFSLPMIGTLGSLRTDQLGNFGTTDTVSFEAVLKARAPGCSRLQMYSWLHREPAPGQEGREQLRAVLFVRCGKVELRDGSSHLGTLQFVAYDGDGRLELVAGPGYVNTFTWSTDAGHALIVGGQAAYADGGRAELTRPEVARTP